MMILFKAFWAYRALKAKSSDIARVYGVTPDFPGFSKWFSRGNGPLTLLPFSAVLMRNPFRWAMKGDGWMFLLSR